MSHYQSADHDHNIKITDGAFENVAEFIYLEQALSE
jgi:hypothetical protein